MADSQIYFDQRLADIGSEDHSDMNLDGIPVESGGEEEERSESAVLHEISNSGRFHFGRQHHHHQQQQQVQQQQMHSDEQLHDHNYSSQNLSGVQPQQHQQIAITTCSLEDEQRFVISRLNDEVFLSSIVQQNPQWALLLSHKLLGLHLSTSQQQQQQNILPPLPSTSSSTSSSSTRRVQFGLSGHRAVPRQHMDENIEPTEDMRGGTLDDPSSRQSMREDPLDLSSMSTKKSSSRHRAPPHKAFPAQFRSFVDDPDGAACLNDSKLARDMADLPFWRSKGYTAASLRASIIRYRRNGDD